MKFLLSANIENTKLLFADKQLKNCLHLFFLFFFFCFSPNNQRIRLHFLHVNNQKMAISLFPYALLFSAVHFTLHFARFERIFNENALKHLVSFCCLLYFFFLILFFVCFRRVFANRLLYVIFLYFCCVCLQRFYFSRSVGWSVRCFELLFFFRFFFWFICNTQIRTFDFVHKRITFIIFFIRFILSLNISLTLFASMHRNRKQNQKK